ncbi:GFA family protein [Pelagibius sp.]|uniref:GFA family protein n=1 Tax=Pelagibius sp. TaxID=1931238 RepID=UPI0026397A3F|nr:GFA family protein [Pelagibius sp.]
MMIRGSCHCGAVRFEYPGRPQWLNRCNCSYCRRAGTLWAYAETQQITLTFEAGATIRYIWGDKTLAFHSCRTCGCTTHWENLDPSPAARMAVNCALAEPAEIAGLRIRHFDGAETWTWLD